MFGDVSRNVWRHSPECLGTFPGMFGDIPPNVWGHSPERLATVPGMFEDIPRNVWRHSPKYNIPPVPSIPLPVPVFLVLYIAPGSVCKKAALKNFAKFTGKQLCPSLFKKTLIYKKLVNGCFWKTSTLRMFPWQFSLGNFAEYFFPYRVTKNLYIYLDSLFIFCADHIATSESQKD